MGFWGNVAGYIRGFRYRDLERQVRSLKRSQDDSAARYGATPQELDVIRKSGYDDLSRFLQLEQQLNRRFSEYEEMAQYSDISLALDVYADEGTIPNADGKVVWAESKDQDVSDLLNAMIKRTNLDKDSWGEVREVCMYGNGYAEPVLYEGIGIIGLAWISPPTMRRIEDEKGLLRGFIQDPSGKFATNYAAIQKAIGEGKKQIGHVSLYEDWEIIHWRIRSDGMSRMYGASALEAARWAFKRLVLLEDSAMLTKITKGVSRYVFNVEMGTKTEREWYTTLDRFAERYKRKKFVDSQGRLRLTTNVLSPDEDIFLPMKDGSPRVQIENLAGSDYQDMSPVDYFQGKMYGALKIPKMRIGSAEEIRKDALIGQDVGFARFIMRVQNAWIEGIEQICRIELLAHGIDPDKVEFDVRMTAPSQIFELARMEVLSARADIMQRWKEFAPTPWILQKFGRLSEEEAAEVFKGFVAERRAMSMLDMEAQNAGMGGRGGGGATAEPVDHSPDAPPQYGADADKPSESYRPVVNLVEKWERRSRESEAELMEQTRRLMRSNAGLRKQMKRHEGFMGEIRRILQRNRAA